MGLHCSKQGYINEFECYGGTRLAPEGECHLAEDGGIVHSKLPFSSPILIQDMNNYVQEKPILDNFTKEIREKLIIGEECNEYQETKFVELPPEKSKQMNSYFVELPPEEEKVLLHELEENSHSDNHIQCVDQMYVMEQNLFDEDRQSEEKNKENNLKDLTHLVESICSVIGLQMNKDVNSDTINNILKVHLNNETVPNKLKLKSTMSKYTSPRQYKGMIFPPPNSEEAEKVCEYIEEKISNYRLELWKKELRQDAKNSLTQRKHFANKSHYQNNGVYQHNSKACYAVPKRSSCNIGDSIQNVRQSSVTCHHREKHIQHSSQTDSRHMINSMHSNSTKPYNNYKIRLRHSCSCPRRLKGNVICNNGKDVDDESHLCKQIKIRTIHHMEYDRLSGSCPDTPYSIASTSSSNSSHCDDPPTAKRNQKRIPKSYESTSARPDVWPGRCASRTDIERHHRVHKETLTRQPCFCKRMLGEDYQCDHYVQQR